MTELIDPAFIVQNPKPASWRRGLIDVIMGKAITLVLASVALLFGVGTFFVLADGATALSPNLISGLVMANLSVLLLLFAVLAGKLTRVWRERRSGRAGSKLHVRLVLLFGVVATVPSIMVAIFASLFFHFGVQAWFNDRVRTALNEGLQASQGYLIENRNTIRSDVLAMAYDLTRVGSTQSLYSADFGTALTNETGLRGLTEAMIFEPVTGQRIVSSGLAGGYGIAVPPVDAINTAKSGGVGVVTSDDGTLVRAVVALNTTPSLMLVVSRPVDRTILDHMQRTERAVQEYNRLDQNRSGLQVTFSLIFAIVSLLVLSAAVLLGVLLANQIARPIGRLTLAAERVRKGDLLVRVPERGNDEIGDLSRAFNRMTGQLAAGHRDLMEAYGQIDERRRFTESVLSGVSAGVIGLDALARIELPNRVASLLLQTDLLESLGRPLADLVPEFSPLIEQVMRDPDRPLTQEIVLGSNARSRTLLVRVGAEIKDAIASGYVVTFDDITELQSAQRKAAWADVARRIAHEIKNPLTPIQLAAERLKRRFTREIKSDPETFAQCADTIIRHVEDIGRMVDEFSRFARMPQPVIRMEDIGMVAREALILQKAAHPEIEFVTQIPTQGPRAPCDRRLIGQAITNLLQNAADAVAMQEGAARNHHPQIDLSVTLINGQIAITVTDNGPGLPAEGRAELTEPYVTTKQKGTGLGLAIVKKIMEDHAGSLSLADRLDTPGSDVSGAEVTLLLPEKIADVA
jgi:two-component system nitrogen regulation sensor histidine kinase NtrY